MTSIYDFDEHMSYIQFTHQVSIEQQEGDIVKTSSFKTVFVAFLMIAVAGFIFIWLGMFNVAANVKHWDVTTSFLEWVRERSIISSVEDMAVPDIKDNQLIAKGAGNYGAMCVQCHLAPGVDSSELYKGLNPQPPAFHKGEISKRDPKATYWIINNGIKMSGMSAWGEYHTDQQIWELVAFVNALPEMNVDTYKRLVGDGKHAHAGGDDHGSNMPAQTKGAKGHHAPAVMNTPMTPMQGTNGGPLTRFRQNSGHHTPAGGSVPAAPAQNQNLGQASQFRQNTDHHAPAGGSVQTPPVQSQYIDRSGQAAQGSSGHHGAAGISAPVSPGQSQFNAQPVQSGGYQTNNQGYQDNSHQGHQDNGQGYQGSSHGYQKNGQRYQGSGHSYQNNGHGYQGSNHDYQNNSQGYQGNNYGYQYNDQGSQPYDAQQYGSQQPYGYQRNDHGHHYQQ